MGKAIDQLREQMAEVADLEAVSAVLDWDHQTYMPPGAAEARAQQMATLDRLAHQKLTSDTIGELLQAAQSEVEGRDPDSNEARLVKVTQRDYDRQRRVPSRWVAEFSRTTALAHQTWQEARRTSNFALFEPSLERIVGLRREYASFFEPYDSIYDPLFQAFEPGMKTAQVRAVFEELRPALVGLVRRIAERADRVDDSFLRGEFEDAPQWEFGLEVLRRMGYDFQRGREDRSAHPFTTSFSNDDVRITTRVERTLLSSALFSSIHEGGHALYDQGVDPALQRSPLAGGASLGLHESQSRLWENLVGRSRPFWKFFFPRLKERFAQLSKVSLEDFYRGVNRVRPSLIRVDADEVTYNLHIMVRFDLEQGLLEGKLRVKDLPQAWNQKMDEYVGIVPPNDAQGVLQDVHWSGGMIGYFPTYTLGNLIAVELFQKALQDCPQIWSEMEQGKFDSLLHWLRGHVHVFGRKFDPLEILQRATGQELSAQPYLGYLQEKYGEIYGL
ncbi:MAG: carboxypeptidase M32 [Anaerolineales bacterium]|jgi:carboxypeptidase Taq